MQTTVGLSDGSRFMEKGVRKAGHTVASLLQTVVVKALPANTSAQNAELVTLIRALQVAKGLKIIIYTDSNYAFLVLCARGTLWKKRDYNQALTPQIEAWNVYSSWGCMPT